MALTPIDVQQKTFGTALRGYDLDEVDDFLDEVVTTLASYEQRLREAQERIAALESEVAEKGDAERAISRALLAAQRSADELVAEARQEAERILAEARSQADELTVQRDRERQTAAEEINRLREVIAELRSRVQTLAESITDDLDAMDEAAQEALSQVGGDEPDVEEGPADLDAATPVATEVEDDAADESADAEETPPEVGQVWATSPAETDEGDGGDEELEVADESEAPPARRPWERD